MPNVRIVTDSTAHFMSPDFPARHQVTVVPLTIRLGDTCIKDTGDLDALQFITRLTAGGSMPHLIAPGADEFEGIYENLIESTNHILSLHISGRLTDTVRNARRAAEELVGRAEAMVIDSRTTSIGLGILVEQLALAAESGASMGELVRQARGLIPRIYGVFYIEALDYLEHAGRIGTAQTMLGTMLGIKPILALEDGEIMPMEKVRTRAQGVEKLVEFVGEFTELERLTVLHGNQNGMSETRQLIDRLSAEFPSVPCLSALFSPSLAAQIGPHGLGVVVFEGEVDEASPQPRT